MSQNLNCAVAVIGIDIGKNYFHIVGVDSREAIVLRQKWSRGRVETAAPQCSCDRARQQAGPDRLERSGPWPKLRGEAGRGVSRLGPCEELTLTCRGLREDETRWRFGLPGVCEHW